ncbi:MAG: hypothetical protein AB7Y46_13865, partial [Armatimonadota bacterium]
MRTLGVLLGMMGAAAAAGAQDYEALPWGDLEYMAGATRGAQAWGVWPRAGEPSGAIGWTVQRTGAAGGAVCVKGSAAGEEFVIGGEGSGPMEGSVKLRADTEGAQAVVRLTWYNRLSPVSATQTLTVGPQWQTVTLSATPDVGGPYELAVAPAGDLPIYADDFSIRCAGPPPNEQMSDAAPIRHRRTAIGAHQQYDGLERDRVGRIDLVLELPDAAEPLVPFAWGGVLFPKGELYRRDRVRVLDADGREVEAQFDVLARWHGDRSIQALLVTVPADAGPRLTLEYGRPPTGPQLRAADLRGRPLTNPVLILLDGTEQQASVRPRAATGWSGLERAGPLATVTVHRWELGPLMVEVRQTWMRDSRRSLLSVCFINEGEPVAVKGLGVRLRREAGAPMLLMSEDGYTPLWAGGQASWGIGPQRVEPTVYGVGPGAELTGAVAVPSGESGIGIAIRDFAENRPSGFTVTQDALTAWAWPPEAGAFVMSQGMARSFDLLIDYDSPGPPRPYRTGDLPLLSARPEWICNSGVFEQLLPPDPHSFPIFERTLGSFETLGRFSHEQKQRGGLYGWFDFGDAPGDGGWSNLETMADHEIFLHFFRTLSREHFDAARLAAEHYRDVDIDHRFGYCHTHCNNHTSSGESWSHAWVQGLRDLYFLTGDGRALAVLGEVEIGRA